jgi:hypothetical protein
MIPFSLGNAILFKERSAGTPSNVGVLMHFDVNRTGKCRFLPTLFIWYILNSLQSIFNRQWNFLCLGQKIIFFYNLFTKSTGKIHCRYEAPREEPREAHGCLAIGWKATWLRHHSMLVDD